MCPTVLYGAEGGQMRPLRIMRVIPRMNVGAPARQVGRLMRGLDPQLFHQRLYVGAPDLEDRHYRQLRLPDVRTYSLPTLGRSGWPSDHARALAALVAEVRDFRPDVVHTHSALAGRLGRIAAGIHGVPIRVHTYDANLLWGGLSPAGSRILIGAERALARSTDSLIAGGIRVRDELLAAGIGRPDQYEVMAPSVSLGLVPDRDEARRTLGLSRGGPVVAFVGQITSVKRPDRLLAVARQLRTPVPDVQFVVCGEGDRLTGMVNQSATHRLNMTFLGWRADVETVYAAADVVLLTSDHEGMPASLIEAGLAGRPVVATDVGSVAEVVRHGETGLLTDRDIPNISRSVERLLRDDSLRRRMGLAAFAETTRRFGSDRLVGDAAELYRRLAVRRGRWPASVMRSVPLPTTPAPTLPTPTTPAPTPVTAPPRTAPAPSVPLRTAPAPTAPAPTPIAPTPTAPASSPPITPEPTAPTAPAPKAPVVPAPTAPVAPAPTAPEPTAPAPTAPVAPAPVGASTESAARATKAARSTAAHTASTASTTAKAARPGKAAKTSSAQSAPTAATTPTTPTAPTTPTVETAASAPTAANAATAPTQGASLEGSTLEDSEVETSALEGSAVEGTPLDDAALENTSP